MEQKAIEWIGQNIVSILVVLSFFIQLAPIKINPWSSLFKWIGKMITAETREDIKALQSIITDQQKAIDENEKDRIRWEILNFANSCRNGRRHTKDEFQHIVTLNTKYRQLLKKTNDINGVFEVEYKYIEKLYEERLEKNDFL